MKKILCLLLTVLVVFSSFAMCLTATAAGEEDIKDRPVEIMNVIDPILIGANTSFANSINEVGYAGVNSYISQKKAITEDTFNSFMAQNASDKMFGVSYDFLYNKDMSSFLWTFLRKKLETDPKIHEKEIAEAETQHRYSTCAMKGAYDACAEMLNNYRYAYGEQKEIDKKLFADIVEEKIALRNAYTGKEEVHYNYYYEFTKGSFSLMRANDNNQIINTISKIWKGNNSFTWKVDALCSSREVANENAIKIANFIGKLLYPNFAEIPASTVVFRDSKSIDTYNFFVKVAEISGLADILQDNWCNATAFNVKGIMQAFGVNTDEYVLLNVETEKGEYMGARILNDMFKSFYSNPVLYVEQLIQKFSKNYAYSYSKAFEALFVLRYPSMAAKSRSGAYQYLESYDGTELKSLDGFLQFIADCLYVNNVDDGNSGATKFYFAPLPVNRISTAADADELHLYMLCYMDINRAFGTRTADGKYISNTTKIDAFINSIVEANKNAVGIETTARVLRSLFSSDLTTVDIITFHLGELTLNTWGSFKGNFMGNIKNSLGDLLQKFIEAMNSLMDVLFGWTDKFFQNDGLTEGGLGKQ